MTKVVTILATAIFCLSYIDCKGINDIGNNRQGRSSTETFFWVITVSAFDFPDDASTTLNTNEVKLRVAAVLQTQICKLGTVAVTDCTVTVLSFTKGSTNINGQTTHTAGQNIQPNVQNNVVTAGLTFADLGGNPATSSSVSMTNFAKCTGDAKCNVGEGDCDNDDECAGGLVCGRNSCDTAFNAKVDINKKKFFPSGQADCCISKKRALFYGRPSRADLEENFQNDEEPF